jgi:hypothetical protein
MPTEGGRRLRDAAERGDTVAVKTELAGGANINDAVRVFVCPFTHGLSPL